MDIRQQYQLLTPPGFVVYALSTLKFRVRYTIIIIIVSYIFNSIVVVARHLFAAIQKFECVAYEHAGVILRSKLEFEDTKYMPYSETLRLNCCWRYQVCLQSLDCSYNNIRDLPLTTATLLSPCQLGELLQTLFN